jgi:hypothetical protein
MKGCLEALCTEVHRLTMSDKKEKTYDEYTSWIGGLGSLSEFSVQELMPEFLI